MQRERFENNRETLRHRQVKDGKVKRLSHDSDDVIVSQEQFIPSSEIVIGTDNSGEENGETTLSSSVPGNGERILFWDEQKDDVTLRNCGIRRPREMILEKAKNG